MTHQGNLQPENRQKAAAILRDFPPSEREALLIKCWMSHDARWFTAVARQYGIQAANQLNQIAARGVGKVETGRLIRALGLPPVKTVDDYILVQEVFISILGPELLEYAIFKTDDSTCEMAVSRCFAHENAVRAGIADDYECGILARVGGWLEALELTHDISPSPGKCFKCQGQECAYRISIGEGAGPD